MPFKPFHLASFILSIEMPRFSQSNIKAVTALFNGNIPKTAALVVQNILFDLLSKSTYQD